MPHKYAFNIFLMVLLTLTEGVSLLLLIPLLELVGLDMGQGSLNQISIYISGFFSSLGVQPTLLIVLAIYIGVISLSALLRRGQMIMNYQIDYHFAAHLRKRLYQAITNSNWLFFTLNKSSDFAHALTNEIERIGAGTSQYFVFISGIMILSVYIIFALELAGIFTGLIFVVGVVLLLLLRKKAYYSRHRGEEITETTRNIYSTIMQYLDGMKTIKSFRMEEENMRVFSTQTDRVVDSYMGTVRSFADVRLFFEIGTVVMLAIIVLVLVNVIQISTATLLVLIYLFVRMVPQFSGIQSSYQYFLNMLPAFQNVIKLEKECKEHQEIELNGKDEIRLKKKIKVEDVNFSYQENQFTLKNLNLKIPAGKTTAIAGPSGSGKSTVADLVIGLIQPQSGKITVDGKSTNLSWRSHIGYVDQETFLFNDTIRYNLQLANPHASVDELTESLKLASAYEFVTKLPEGLDTVIGDRGGRLSGGERQRIALARALLRKPSLLILDEATSNLDSENENRIIEAIDNLHGELTILVIAHRFSTIKNADNIYLMEEGRILDSGTWKELLEKEKGWFWDNCEVQGVNPSTGP